MDMQELFTYENEGSNTYLVYQVGEKDEVDSIGLGMLNHNKPEGFMPFLFTQMNEAKYFKYNITSFVSLQKVLEGRLRKNQILKIFRGIIDAVISADEYMIDQQLLVLNSEYIFTDLSTYETRVVCLPVINHQNANDEVELFLKKIMFSVQYDTSENGDYVTKIMNYLNSREVFSAVGFRDLLKSIREEKKKMPSADQESEVKIRTETRPAQPTFQSVPVQSTFQPMPANPTPRPMQMIQPVSQGIVSDNSQTEQEEEEEDQITLFHLLQHYNKENAALYKAQKEKRKLKKLQEKGKAPETNKGMVKNTGNDLGFAVPGQEAAFVNDLGNIKNSGMNFAGVQMTNQEPVILQGEDMDFGETVVMMDDEGTVCLDESEISETKYPYLINKENEKVVIDKDFFKIGKETGYADYCIRNRAVSHRHAYIINRNGAYFVVDTNSKNHTYINDKKIQDNTEMKLEHKDRIRFANEEVEFYLY